MASKNPGNCRTQHAPCLQTSGPTQWWDGIHHDSHLIHLSEAPPREGLWLAILPASSWEPDKMPPFGGAIAAIVARLHWCTITMWEWIMETDANIFKFKHAEHSFSKGVKHLGSANIIWYYMIFIDLIFICHCWPSPGECQVSPVNLAGPVSPVWCSVPQPSEPSSCSVDFIGKWFLREVRRRTWGINMNQPYYIFIYITSMI